jgi:hypothetical protein
MEETSCFMPYYPCGNKTAQIQGAMVPQNAVSLAYSPAPMSPMAAMTNCHYQSPYGPADCAWPYQSSLVLKAVGSPLTQGFHHCSPITPMGKDSEAARIATPHQNPRQMSDTYLQSPARSDPNASLTNSDSLNSTAGWKIVTRNQTINPADCVNFNTAVDELMKVIQAKDGVRYVSPSQILSHLIPRSHAQS